MLAGIDRLLPPLCARLGGAGRGARRVRLTLAPHRRPEPRCARSAWRGPPTGRRRSARCSRSELGEIDAGFGIEVIRLEACAVEPLSPRQHRGQLAATAAAARPPGETEGHGRPHGPDRRPARARRARPPASRRQPHPGEGRDRDGRRLRRARRRLAAARRAAAGADLPARAADPRGRERPPGALRLAPPPMPPRRRLRAGAHRARNGGSTIPPGAPARATTGGSRPRRGRGSGSTRPRGASSRPAGSRKASSHEPAHAPRTRPAAAESCRGQGCEATAATRLALDAGAASPWRGV